MGGGEKLTEAGGLLTGAGTISIINQLLMTAACISVSPFYKGQCHLGLLRLGRVCLLYSGRNFLCAVLTDNSCKVLGSIFLILKLSKV